MLKCIVTYYHLNGCDAGFSLSLLCCLFKNQPVALFLTTPMVVTVQAYEKGLMIAVIPFTSKV